MIELTFPDKTLRECPCLAGAAEMVAAEAAGAAFGLGPLSAAALAYHCALGRPDAGDTPRPVRVFDVQSEGADLIVRLNESELRFVGGNGWELRGLVETWAPLGESVSDVRSALAALGWICGEPADAPLPVELRQLLRP